MGYTHYWKSAGFNAEQWAKLSDGARAIILAAGSAGIALAGEWDEPVDLPVVDGDCIRFNGTGNDGHETFYLAVAPVEFGFCKTAFKPYDAAVVAILMLASECGPFTWSSDGDEEDWAGGRELLAAGRGMNSPTKIFVNDIEVTAPQAEAIYSIYRRPVVGNGRSFEEFVIGLAPMIGGDGAVVIPWCGMVLAIEPDGLVHS